MIARYHVLSTETDPIPCLITGQTKYFEPLNLVLSECVVKYLPMNRKKRRIESEEKCEKEEM